MTYFVYLLTATVRAPNYRTQGHATFLLPSNLPVASPLGTILYLPGKPEYVSQGYLGAGVFRYEHEYTLRPNSQVGHLGDIYMILGDRNRENFYVKAKLYSSFKRAMLDFGWNVAEESSNLQLELTNAH